MFVPGVSSTGAELSVAPPPPPWISRIIRARQKGTSERTGNVQLGQDRRKKKREDVSLAHARPVITAAKRSCVGRRVS